MRKLFSALVLVLFSVFAWAELPVNVNKADAQILADSLSGVGLKKAEAIVAWRDVNGKFTAIEQMLEVKGLGDHFLLKNKERVVFK